MNREIKFRGKRIDNGEWVYGDLLQPTEICDIYEISNCESIDGTRYEVIPETIGQYTGLHDKNGKEIYEGDIVKYETFWEGDCEYEGGMAVIYWDNEDTGFYCECQEYHYSLDMFNLTRNLSPEIIGNIYDNPELLGGE